MKRKLGIIALLFCGFFNCTFSQNILRQVQGGSEFRFLHRPDISDSTYQIFLRKNWTWHGDGASNVTYSFGGNVLISLVDTCSLRFKPISLPIYWESTTIFNPLLALNPNTGDSASKRIFQVCNSVYPDSIVKFSTPGPIYNNAIGEIQLGFKDTFELLRDYWYDTIIHLPEPCGLWQVHNGGFASLSLPQYCGYGSTLTPFGTGSWWGTNVDSAYVPTYAQGMTPGVGGQIHNGVTQINTTIPNSSPYFLSQPTAVFIRNVPSFYAMNAVDPDGDSLSFSSISLVFPDSAQGNRPMSHFLPWAPFRYCIDYTSPNWDTTMTCFRNILYKCPPGSFYPNCTRYDPVYNPFDTDSTFQLN
ncbi:MAG: hypothetical protein ACOYLG_12845, partial [Chitinophagaceae bacterium]